MCHPVLSHTVCCQTFQCFLQILKRNESLSNKAGDPPSSAILVVYLDKAEELPVSHLSLPSVPKFVLSSVLHSVSVVYLRHSFNSHLSGTPQNCCLSRNDVEVSFPFHFLLCLFITPKMDLCTETVDLCCLLIHIDTSRLSHVVTSLLSICAVAMAALYILFFTLTTSSKS